jgi:NAD(P)H-hydrate epimerase
MCPLGGRLLLLAGKGHNGDDVRAALGHFGPRRVDLLDVTDPGKDLERLRAQLALKPDLIVDGLFGIGLNRPLDIAWCTFINCVNATERPLLSVDVPSGLNAETGEPMGAAVRASVTLTVGAPKKGLLAYSATCFVGRLEVAGDVGLAACSIPSKYQWTVPADFIRFPPPRRIDGHKGTYGHLGIFAGSAGYHGAAVLAARGAQRARPGLVTVITAHESYQAIAAQSQAVMVSAWSEEISLLERFTAVLAGPGLAARNVPEQMKARVLQDWNTAPCPIVLDASALDWLQPSNVQSAAARVLTPHPGEAARLLGCSTGEVQADRFGAVRELSARFGNAYVVLKGHATLIGRSTGDIFVNSSGNPDLAQGGSGDLLAGYITGLLAQPVLQADPLSAIRYAVWQHGASADRLSRSRRAWVIEDLASNLGEAEPTS